MNFTRSNIPVINSCTYRFFLRHMDCSSEVMNRTWIISILGLSFILLALQKSHEQRSLSSFYRADRVLKLESFNKARAFVAKSDIELLELWESILTGRSAPLSRIMKEHYKTLGLNHIFTPSGFHLSAVLFPFMKLLKGNQTQLLALALIGVLLTFLPGLGALKRMVLVKGSQKLLGLKTGFIAALILDILFGTFQNSTLSFTYSFLFLGIIYGGAEGLLLVIWFFFGQMLIAYFQGNDISPLLLLFSPVLNIVFASVMPILFLLSFPLWEWQVHTGLFLLKKIQLLVDLCANISLNSPTIEINIVTLAIAFLPLKRNWKLSLAGIFIFTSSLNPDLGRSPGAARMEYVPHGSIVKRVYSEKNVTVYFKDGRCRMKLVRGFWYENCSPRRRSNYLKKRIS